MHNTATLKADVRLLGTSLAISAGKTVVISPATNLPIGGMYYVKPLGLWEDGLKHDPDDTILVNEKDLELHFHMNQILESHRQEHRGYTHTTIRNVSPRIEVLMRGISVLQAEPNVFRSDDKGIVIDFFHHHIGDVAAMHTLFNNLEDSIYFFEQTEKTWKNFEHFCQRFHEKDARFANQRVGQAFCNYFGIADRNDIFYEENVKKAYALITQLTNETFTH